MNHIVPLLIIGAGPYGLAAAAYCREIGIEHLLLGEPMAFWKWHMPRKMYLRSRGDWHLDPTGRATFDRYLANRGLPPGRTEPISNELYLGYADWFQREHEIRAERRMVRRLIRNDHATVRFEALLEDGRLIGATNVLVSTGFAACANVPTDVAHLFPSGRVWHAQDAIDFRRVAGRSILIIGGRQSAFEWAAIARENGAQVHISYRHDTPGFELADWSWVTPLLERTEVEPSWYRRLPEPKKNELLEHMWTIGRLRLEPWLERRVLVDGIRLWPNSRPAECVETGDGRLRVQLNTGHAIIIDRVVLATGYRTDVRQVPFLDQDSIVGRLDIQDGFPILGEAFQSSVSGLYFVNRFASRDFGHFFDFTAGVRVAARMIARSVMSTGQMESGKRVGAANPRAASIESNSYGIGRRTMNFEQAQFRIKRSCLHNVRVGASNPKSPSDVPEGLVIPEELMRAADIAPYEQIIVTKIGGTNWINRMYSFAVPGRDCVIEARGSVGYLLSEGDLCCVITGSYISQEENERHLASDYDVPIVDVRLYPENDKVNDLSNAKIVLEHHGKIERVSRLSTTVMSDRQRLPRIMLSNLLSGLRIEEVERRGCIEMSAELPITYMRLAGFSPNQTIFVYNASRGGASAESYVVPSLTKKTVGISGALCAVADVGDVISEAAFAITSEPRPPTICNLAGRALAAE